MSKPFIMWDFGLGSGVGWMRVRVGCGNVETQYFASLPRVGFDAESRVVSDSVRIGCVNAETQNIASLPRVGFDAESRVVSGIGSMRQRRDAIFCVFTPGRIRCGIACGFGYWFDASTRRRKILRLYAPPGCCEFPFKFQLFFNVPIDVAAIFVHSWPTMNRYTLLNSGMKDKGE